MNGHWIALAILAPVAIGSWAALHWVALPRLVAASARGPAVGIVVATGSTVAEVGVGADEVDVAPVRAAVLPSGSAVAVAETPGSAGGAAGAEGLEVGAEAPAPTASLRFPRRSVRFEPAARRAIFALVRELKTEPTRRVRLVGHADTGSDGPDAESLPGRRAEGVRQFMITLGVTAERIEASAAPVTDGDEARRSVEVFVE